MAHYHLRVLIRTEFQHPLCQNILPHFTSRQIIEKENMYRECRNYRNYFYLVVWNWHWWCLL